jgi:hypothetical protein
MDRERKANLKRASPLCRKRRVTGTLRKTLESGVSSTIALGTTLMNVAQLMVELKYKESNPDLDPNSENNKRRQIIDA